MLRERLFSVWFPVSDLTQSSCDTCNWPHFSIVQKLLDRYFDRLVKPEIVASLIDSLISYGDFITYGWGLHGSLGEAYPHRRH